MQAIAVVAMIAVVVMVVVMMVSMFMLSMLVMNFDELEVLSREVLCKFINLFSADFLWFAVYPISFRSDSFGLIHE